MADQPDAPHDPARPAEPWGSVPPSGPPSPGPPPSYPPYPAHPVPATYGPGGPERPHSGPQRRSRLPLVLGVVAAVVVLALAITVPLALSGDDGPDSATAADLADVQVYDDLPTTHVDGSIVYDQSPPPGGEHAPQWLDCGVYDSPVPDENAVHDLEHGTFWFTYDPAALSATDVDTLAAALPDNGIMSPYEGLDAPVVVTVWGRQLALTGVDDERLAMFLDEYAGGETAPEPMASCAGGLTADEALGTVSS